MNAIDDALRAIDELLAEAEIRQLRRDIGLYAPPYAGPREIALGIFFTPEMIARKARTMAGLVPILSDTLDLMEAATGVEIGTGRRLSEVERGIAGLSVLFPAIISGAGIAIRQAVRSTGQVARASRRVAAASTLLVHKLQDLARMEGSLPSIQRALRALQDNRLPTLMDLRRLRNVLVLIKDLHQSLPPALRQAIEQIAAAGRLVTTVRRIGGFLDLGPGRLLVGSQWLRGRLVVTARAFYFRIDQGGGAIRQLFARIGSHLDDWAWEANQGVTLSALGAGTLNSAAARAYEYLSGLVRGSRRGSLLMQGNGVYLIRFKEIIEDAMQNLYDRGIRGRHPSVYGTILHGELNRLLRNASLPILPRGSIISEVTFGNLGRRLGIPRQILNMRVADYVATLDLPEGQRRALLRALRQEPTSSTRIRELKPDTIVLEPRGVVTVLDLTSRTVPEHLAKTAFYRALLAQGNADAVGMAEIYWRALRRREP